MMKNRETNAKSNISCLAEVLTGRLSHSSTNSSIVDGYSSCPGTAFRLITVAIETTDARTPITARLQRHSAQL